MSNLPNDPAEREGALKDALEARRGRAQVIHDLNSGARTIREVLEAGAYGQHTDEVGHHARIIGRMDVGTAVTALNGIGVRTALEILDGIAQADEHLDTLNADQRDAILQRCARLMGGYWVKAHAASYKLYVERASTHYSARVGRLYLSWERNDAMKAEPFSTLRYRLGSWLGSHWRRIPLPSSLGGFRA